MKVASILVYGHDLHLLETRRWVLESAGFQAAEAVEFAELECLGREESIKLLILCHSLSLPDVRNAAAWAERREPALPCLFLLNNDTERPPDLQGERLGVAGPPSLIAAVKRILSQEESSVSAA